MPAAGRGGAGALTRELLTLDGRARPIFETLLGSGDFRVPAENHYEVLRHSLRAAHARGHDASRRTGSCACAWEVARRSRFAV